MLPYCQPVLKAAHVVTSGWAAGNNQFCVYMRFLQHETGNNPYPGSVSLLCIGGDKERVIKV